MMSNFIWIYYKFTNVTNSIVREERIQFHIHENIYIYMSIPIYSRNLTMFYLISFSMIVNLGELHVRNSKSISFNISTFFYRV